MKLAPDACYRRQPLCRESTHITPAATQPPNCTPHHTSSHQPPTHLGHDYVCLVLHVHQERDVDGKLAQQAGEDVTAEDAGVRASLAARGSGWVGWGVGGPRGWEGMRPQLAARWVGEWGRLEGAGRGEAIQSRAAFTLDTVVVLLGWAYGVAHPTRGARRGTYCEEERTSSSPGAWRWR